jgi:signal transduction histidine kinase
MVAPLLLVAAAAAGAIVVRAADPEQTLAGPGAGPVVLLLAVAAALAAAGVVAWRLRPRAAAGPLLLCGAATWCTAQLDSQAAPTAVLFTAGLAFAAAAPGAIAPALLPDRRAGAALVVASVGLLGVISAATFDPVASGCAECPSNLLLVRGDAGLFTALQRAGLWIGLVSILWLMVTAVAWLGRAGRPARARRGPAIVAATVFLGAVAARYVHAIPRGYLAADPTDRALWTVQGSALLLVAAGVVWEPVRRRRARARLAQLVIDLEGRPARLGLRDVLADVLGDPGVDLVYPLADGRRIDAEGRPARPHDGQAVTVLRDGERPLAEVRHSPGRIEDPALASAIAAAAGLALHNERLRAELLARLEDLRAMRARIVAAGDGERRRLERDLHDGAQQRLATLAIRLESARRRASAGDRARLFAGAHADVRAALGELREIAHGLVPAVLSDEGIGPALEAYAETADADVRVAAPLPGDRFAPAVETTAYHVVTEAIRRAGASAATIRIARVDGRLVLSVAATPAPPGDLVDLDDRVGALGGALHVERERVVAELPCA